MAQWRVRITGFFLVCFLFVLVPHVYADTSYVVKPGDNLFRIALNHGLTTQVLARANGITNPAHIYVGQVLVIPDPSSANRSQSLAASASTIPEGSTYVVRRGDTLFGIARTHGVSAQALASTNGIANLSRIYIGQRLTIPGSGSATTAAPAPSTPGVSREGGERWIDIDLSLQQLTAYEGDLPVFTSIVSTGTPAHPTVVGQFRIWNRTPRQTMDGRRLGYNYVLPNVPFVQYFYKDYAIHGTYWHDNFGTPMSHGCVNMTIPDAEWLYNWSDSGTLVNVHY